MNKASILVFLFLIALTQNISAQNPLQVEIESGTIVSSGDVVPLWLRANQFGIYDWQAKFQSQLFGKAYYENEFSKYLKLKAGVSGILKSNIDTSFVHEAYLNLKTVYNIELKLGQEAYSPLDGTETLGSGHFLMGMNARPVPQIGLGIFEYTDVPFTQGYVQIRGGVMEGLLMDNRGNGVDKPRLHQKFAYISTNQLPVNFYAGLTHIALYGGTLADGREIPVDYMSVFLTRGSDAVGEVLPGEKVNVAGGHIGNFDFGTFFSIHEKRFEVSIQKFFEDGSGVNGYFAQNKDMILGIKGELSEHGLVTNFSYEYVKTDWQSGPGNHGAVVDGVVLSLKEIDDYDQYLFDHFGLETNVEDVHEFSQILRDHINYGFDFGGRDNYYNNYVYKKGYTNYGYTMGIPYFNTSDMLNAIVPDGFSGWFIYNTRIKGHHFGIRGELNPQLHYQLRTSFMNNLGNYSDVSKAGVVNPDSFFAGGKRQNYTSLELNKSFENIPLEVIGTLGADFGEMYDSYGLQVKLRYWPLR